MLADFAHALRCAFREFAREYRRARYMHTIDNNPDNCPF